MCVFWLTIFSSGRLQFTDSCSVNIEQVHIQHIHTVLTRLQEFGLVLNISKCQFGLREVEFLGHRVSATKVEPLIRHVAAMQEFSQPIDIPQLQKFLGMINFYHGFFTKYRQNSQTPHICSERLI